MTLHLTFRSFVLFSPCIGNFYSAPRTLASLTALCWRVLALSWLLLITQNLVCTMRLHLGSDLLLQRFVILLDLAFFLQPFFGSCLLLFLGELTKLSLALLLHQESNDRQYRELAWLTLLRLLRLSF